MEGIEPISGERPRQFRRKTRRRAKGSIVQKRYSNLSYIYETFSLSLTLGLAIEKKVRNWEKDTRAKKGSLPEGNQNISTSIISESTTSFVRY